MSGTITRIERAQATRLAEQFRAGDKAAYGALYSRFRDAVFAAAVGIVRCAQDAEDVVQDTFMRAWKSREKLRDPARIKAWLTRIAANLAKTLYGRRRRCVEDAGVLERVAVAPEAHVALESAQQRGQLREAIATLTPRQCQVVTLRVERELSFKEIAETLGCSNVSARVNFTYGVRSLRQVMAA